MAQATPFQKEAWTEYGIGVLIILGRIFARWKVVGVKNWQGDDYFAILALLFWTAELTMLELIGQHGANIGLTNAQRAAMTPDQVKSLVIGSKCLLAGWVCYVTLIWCLKACMLFFYNRLTLGLIQQKLVRINAVLCALSYVAVIFTIFFHCLPIQKHWQIYPDPGDHCTVDRINYIVLAVTNVCTDAVLVSIPVPLLAKVRLALRRKLVIGVLLCGGVFVMCAALLRCILSLRSINSINTSTIWAIRETFVALIAVNAPCIKPLFSSSVWLGSSKDPSSKNAHRYGESGSYSLSVFGKSKPDPLVSHTSKLGDHASDEFILREQRENGPTYVNDVSGGHGQHTDEESGKFSGGGIQVTTMYEVRTGRA
ncbi:hypothetical protein KXW98_002504 [Aspergillus fumigatus]|uniref:Rhodopsin domain-containing protein n=1 Tax=Aspergillus fumigatus (strain CBS 144.89 / FGSC A1163 / CEA10) TaxID=451804 RepID=B0XWP3_ASPFC|nr:conserved hypothetical protein [Aspergillus fumigatus A1163]KAF4277743.1 hypothetical protein CNMCM8057_002267 [Aspergillus fumigatus]KAF4288191.1 hypothetical protein CNMCM8689_006472 [Aspergillus fumigatus]KAF4294744.1 hypothetical protein CNMCM8686_002521 [Aspergillus fumigatus]KAH1279135.1 hypothetical protein KXX45_008072 [Aspergillus fumigatus]